MQSNYVVYQFTCPEDGCQASYVGYTTNTLLTRSTQHRSSPSKIFEHFLSDHDKLPPKNLNLSFKVIYKNNNLRELKIGEAIVIKMKKPNINIIYNEISPVSYLF